MNNDISDAILFYSQENKAISFNQKLNDLVMPIPKKNQSEPSKGDESKRVKFPVVEKE